MIGLIQRVTEARVDVAGETIGKIGNGLLVLVGLEKGDSSATAEKLLSRILSYRVFQDSDDKMNLSLQDVQGGLLLVSQFTLAADTRKGKRPSFSSAMPPAEAETLFAQLVEKAQACHHDVATGQFGADMQVSLCNDGPVTFNLRVPPEVSQ